MRATEVPGVTSRAAANSTLCFSLKVVSCRRRGANSRRHFLFGSRMVDDGPDKKQRAAASSTPENFRHFAAKPHHANRKAEYQGQHDDPRARLPMTKQSGQKCPRQDYGQ